MSNRKSYLLSDGSYTNSLPKYVEDIIRIELTLRSNDIPYQNTGNSNKIRTLNDNEVNISIRTLVSELVAKVNEQFPSVTVTILDIEIVGIKVNVNLLINGKSINYEF